MWPFKKSEKERIAEQQLREAYAEYRKHVLPVSHRKVDDLHLIIAPCILLENEAGRMAVSVGMKWPGNKAIHEINNDGTFSKERPYWLHKNDLKWKPSGRFVLAAIAQVTEGGAFKSSNRHEGTVQQIGYKVLEMDTIFRPDITFDTFRDFKFFQ